MNEQHDVTILGGPLDGLEGTLEISPPHRVSEADVERRRLSHSVWFACVVGRKRSHLVQRVETVYGPFALAGEILRSWFGFDPPDDVAWQAETTLCGLAGPFESAQISAQLCRRCSAGSWSWDAAPEHLRPALDVVEDDVRAAQRD